MHDNTDKASLSPISAIVVNIRSAPTNWRDNCNYVYIGRPSVWGNPYRVSQYGRERAIDKYALHATQSGILNLLYELKGKKLVCHCAPDKCHGDFLADAANKLRI